MPEIVTISKSHKELHLPEQTSHFLLKRYFQREHGKRVV